MARIVVRHGFLVPLLLGMILFIGPLPLPAQARIPLQDEFPPQCWLPEGSQDSLNIAEISAMFDTVITATGKYREYDFTLDVGDTPSGALLPVLAKSVGGVESRWIQFVNGVTLVVINPHPDPAKASCDYGLMQVNSQNESLFPKRPSLRAYTDGNIAAGASVLANWWNFGIPGQPGPAVNDLDPERLINWYYTLSNYNGGSGGGTWANNPNCGKPELREICGGSNFRPSRADGADWEKVSLEHYPYQERVLYNLAYPRYPENQAEQWRVGHLGLLSVVSLYNYGIRPADALFLRTDPDTSDPINYTPNILLFLHHASAVRERSRPQDITFEYDLPLDARVTIEIINPDITPQTIAVVDSPAGWTRLVVSTGTDDGAVPIQAGAHYRITAERGDPSDSATYWIGQYEQAFTFGATANAPTANRPFRVALPFVAHHWQPLLPPPNEVWNGDFRHVSWLTMPDNELSPPAYWDMQTILSTQDGAYALLVSDVLRRVPNNDTAARGDYQMLFTAAPGARAELSQRVNVDTPGNYRLAFTIDIPTVLADSATSLEVRVRPVRTGRVRWRSVERFTAADVGTDNKAVSFLVRNVSDPMIISFVATFDTKDGKRSGDNDTVLASNFYIRDVSFSLEP